MRRLGWLLVLLLPTAAWADEIAVVPSVGWGWGGTQQFDLAPLHGDVHLDASAEYGIGVGAYGRIYGAELVYHRQPTEAVVRVDGFGELGRVDLAMNYVLLEVLRQFPRHGWTPFLVGGAGGVGFYAAGTNSWDFALSLGGGVRRRFANGGGVHVMARLLASAPVTDNGFSFGAAGGGVSFGGQGSLYRGDVSLGYAFPLWRGR